MLRILLTGMSGVGKSSVVIELRSRGYRAVDLDDGWCDPEPDGRQRIDESAVLALFDADRSPVLFLAGCEENQSNLYDRLDHVVLLTAPVELMLERVRDRTSNPYGQSSEDSARIIADVREVEPLLRRGADHVVQTDRPLGAVVDAVLSLVALPMVAVSRHFE